MTTLLTYLAVALGFSFFCSIAEAVLLSVTTAYIKLLEQEDSAAAERLLKLKSDIDSPLAAILSLNTIAHTVGAVGVGAQAAIVFGSHAVGLASAILTFLILVFSEIIPKTIGAVYWRKLAPGIGYALKYLVIALYPLVWLSKRITRRIVDPSLESFSREEFTALAHVGEQEGAFEEREAQLIKNVLSLQATRVADAMTPNTVVFSLAETCTVELFFSKYDDQRFSRIPIFEDSPDNITGFVLRGDLLTAQARGNQQKILANYRREILALPAKFTLLTAFELILDNRSQIMYVVDEYGSLKGIITLEDILEELMGQEIVDEGDIAPDMQHLARKKWRKKARKMGIDIDKH